MTPHLRWYSSPPVIRQNMLPVHPFWIYLGILEGLSKLLRCLTWTSGDLRVRLSHALPLGIIHFWHPTYLIIISPASSVCYNGLCSLSSSLSYALLFWRHWPFPDFSHHLAKSSIFLPLWPISCVVLYQSPMVSLAHSTGCLPALFLVVLPFFKKKSGGLRNPSLSIF